MWQFVTFAAKMFSQKAKQKTAEFWPFSGYEGETNNEISVLLILAIFYYPLVAIW